MIRDCVSVDEVIDLLNEALTCDPEAVERLINARVPCNGKMADHPSIQVGVRRRVRDQYCIGPLGLLNGLFGTDERGYGPLQATLENGKIIRFGRTPPPQADEKGKPE